MTRFHRSAAIAVAILLCVEGTRAVAGGEKPKPITDVGEERAAARCAQRVPAPPSGEQPGGALSRSPPSCVHRPVEAKQIRAILERHPKIMDVLREVIADIEWKVKKGKKKGGRGLLQGTDASWAMPPPLCASYRESLLGPPLSPAPHLSHHRPPPPLAPFRP